MPIYNRSLRVEVEGPSAYIHLPRSIELARVFVKSKRIELVLESDDIQTKVIKSKPRHSKAQRANK